MEPAFKHAPASDMATFLAEAKLGLPAGVLARTRCTRHIRGTQARQLIRPRGRAPACRAADCARQDRRVDWRRRAERRPALRGRLRYRHQPETADGDGRSAAGDRVAPLRRVGDARTAEAARQPRDGLPEVMARAASRAGRLRPCARRTAHRSRFALDPGLWRDIARVPAQRRGPSLRRGDASASLCPGQAGARRSSVGAIESRPQRA